MDNDNKKERVMKKDCIIIKKSEYDGLVAKAEVYLDVVRPDEMKIMIHYNSPINNAYLYTSIIESTIDLSSGIKSQIYRIIKIIQEKIDKKIIKNHENVKSIYQEKEKHLAKQKNKIQKEARIKILQDLNYIIPILSKKDKKLLTKGKLDLIELMKNHL